MSEAFDLSSFLPYLLNQAAERVGKSFESCYQENGGVSRVEWRVIAHLAPAGRLTAADISRLSSTEKSQVSRAVSSLERAGLLTRQVAPADRRAEWLELSDAGLKLHAQLATRAQSFDLELRRRLGARAADSLERALRALIGTDSVHP